MQVNPLRLRFLTAMEIWCEPYQVTLKMASTEFGGI